jgi:hypothetical protein
MQVRGQHAAPRGVDDVASRDRSFGAHSLVATELMAATELVVTRNSWRKQRCRRNPDRIIALRKEQLEDQPK